MAIAIGTIRLFEQTQKLDRLKSEFVSKVSHELRTPLTSIKGFTEILLTYEDIDLKTQKEFLGIINEESERLTRLINDVLDLSKIESGRTQWQIQPVAVPEIIRAAVKLLQSMILEKNLELELRIPEDLPIVRGDRDPLLQVLDNLLGNAVKFTPSGKITVAADREGEFVRVSVSDTGPGIPRQDQTKIFEKFFQRGDASTAKARGTGLGLAICKEIIAHLGGRIWSESEPGRGSTFHFTLPVWTKDVRHTEPPVGTQEPQTRS
jgi:signal transduction histidine kinase